MSDDELVRSQYARAAVYTGIEIALDKLKAQQDSSARFSLPKRFDSYKDITEEDLQGDYGFHAGDLGKAEPRGAQGYYRDTGHYGTGTYFGGDPRMFQY
jgi:hypothetical protein